MEALIAYISYPIFLVAYIKGVQNAILVCRASPEAHLHPEAGRLSIFLAGVLDVVFLGRLFKVNKALWIGEWLFHLTFVLTLIGHLRFILYSPPAWMSTTVCIGKYAGLFLPFTIVYILFVRIMNRERKHFISIRNIMLITHIGFLGLTGVLMRYMIRPDIISVKHFMISLLALRPVMPPPETLFIIHYLLFLGLLLYIPSHIIGAPLVIIAARLRGERAKLLHYPGRETTYD